MFVRRTSLLPCSVQRCRDEIAKTASLLQVSAPMLSYLPLSPPELGERWQGRRYRVRLLLGGVLSIGEHTLDIEIPPTGPPGTEYHDGGGSALVKTWDHRIILEDFHGLTRYTDLAEIRAGLLTPVAWLFGWWLYRHRQRRWQALVNAGFADR